MSPLRVVVTDQVFPDLDVERELLHEIGAELTVAAEAPAQALELARDADALLNTYMPFGAEAIAQLERCRIIARYGIGVDNIDLEAARAAGIVVTNVPDYCVEEVATHTLALLLSLWRRVPEGDSAIRRGEWGVDVLGPVRRLSESTVGLVGLGRIGMRVVDALRPLGATIVAHDPYVTQAQGVELVDLHTVLERCDAVSLHTPLTPETKGLIGRAELARMPEHAVLVNTSRGPLVVLHDLIAALRDGSIGGAALDVFQTEPPDPAQLRDVPGLLVTPHVAFYSDAAIRESQRKAVTQILKVLRGDEPDYRVN